MKLISAILLSCLIPLNAMAAVALTVDTEDENHCVIVTQELVSVSTEEEKVPTHIKVHCRGQEAYEADLEYIGITNFVYFGSQHDGEQQLHRVINFKK